MNEGEYQRIRDALELAIAHVDEVMKEIDRLTARLQAERRELFSCYMQLKGWKG